MLHQATFPYVQPAKSGQTTLYYLEAASAVRCVHLGKAAWCIERGCAHTPKHPPCLAHLPNKSASCLGQTLPSQLVCTCTGFPLCLCRPTHCFLPACSTKLPCRMQCSKQQRGLGVVSRPASCYSPPASGHGALAADTCSRDKPSLAEDWTQGRLSGAGNWEAGRSEAD